MNQDPDWIRAHFGEQDFRPQGGYVLRHGQVLPPLVWDDPQTVALVLDDLSITTRWFDDAFNEVSEAHGTGLYYVYGEVRNPNGLLIKRAKTCYCVAADADLLAMAEQFSPIVPYDHPEESIVAAQEIVDAWCTEEVRLFHLCVHLSPINDKRPGAWEMHNASQHVRLKRHILNINNEPIHVSARQLKAPAPVLHIADYAGEGPDQETADAIARVFSDWYAATGVASSLIVAHEGRIVLTENHGEEYGEPVDVHTPFLLHSAMKPLLGIHLAMWHDQGYLKFTDRVGDYLSDFDSDADARLDFHACQVHTTGIEMPWDLAFSRLFYFHTWFETLVAQQPRMWQPWEQYQYGMVGMALTARAQELLAARNYWEAMESELFEPMGITDMWPGGTGFSTENLARLGVLMCNQGSYGDKEFFSPQTYQEIIPAPLTLLQSEDRPQRGIGFGGSQKLGPGSYGHGGGCGTHLLINPQRSLVLALMRNSPGDDYKDWFNRLCEPLCVAVDK